MYSSERGSYKDSFFFFSDRLLVKTMRYYYEPLTEYTVTAAEIYTCDHELYSKCTLYRFGLRGLAVVQQRWSERMKVTWWGPIDPWLIDDIWNRDGFMQIFDKYADQELDGVYPTVSVRWLMWQLRMKPIRKAPWERDIFNPSNRT